MGLGEPGKPTKLEDLDEITLTAGDAFLALGLFVDQFAERVKPEAALATLCADVRVEKDQMSTDPAALGDWAKCVQGVLSREDRSSLFFSWNDNSTS